MCSLQAVQERHKNSGATPEAALSPSYLIAPDRATISSYKLNIKHCLLAFEVLFVVFD